nr:immunoglobulin light chain junction region [Macaca mulatta]MOX41741.1 immunoglobulin light chain junction region [Macaca mulatta]MOX41899.1 immunoglobulin light chain junction region [Macaca mulatta]MOX42186.1 immunoglobulin light chain junction region [Macaca mulatta]MOX42780.1 immunoglobulin light chain junction region [Macaca mulatta]
EYYCAVWDDGLSAQVF